MKANLRLLNVKDSCKVALDSHCITHDSILLTNLWDGNTVIASIDGIITKCTIGTVDDFTTRTNKNLGNKIFITLRVQADESIGITREYKFSLTCTASKDGKDNFVVHRIQ